MQTLEHSHQIIERARRLRQQADGCVDLAAKAPHPRMFHKYIELADSYRRQADEIEGGLEAAANDAT